MSTSPFLIVLAWALAVTAATVWSFRRARYSGANLALVTLGGLSWLLVLWAAVLRHADADTALRTSLVLMVALLGVAVAALCVNGVVMLRKEGRSLANLLSLLLAAALAGLAALVGVAVRWNIHWLEALAGPLMVAASYGVITMAGFVAYSIIVSLLPVRGPADAVVVLGSGLVGGGRVPPLLAGRLDAGLGAWRRLQRGGHAAPLLVPSGGQGHDESRAEGDAMGEYLLQHEPDAASVLRIEDRARTTRENLLYSRALVPVGAPRLVVATSDYHVLRAGRLAHALGLDATVVGSRTARYYVPSALLREYVATLMAARWVHATLLGVLVGTTIVSLVLAHH